MIQESTSLAITGSFAGLLLTASALFTPEIYHFDW